MALSNKERQAAYRARQRERENEFSPASGIDEVPAKDELDEAEDEAPARSEDDQGPVRKDPSPPSLPSEDEYVRQCLSEPAILDQARGEVYARWRYRGFLAGRVASL
jgi:hypothetical protein